MPAQTPSLRMRQTILPQIAQQRVIVKNMKNI